MSLAIRLYVYCIYGINSRFRRAHNRTYMHAFVAIYDSSRAFAEMSSDIAYKYVYVLMIFSIFFWTLCINTDHSGLNYSSSNAESICDEPFAAND